jgi:polyhydroxybutyrate depolymerase
MKERICVLWSLLALLALVAACAQTVAARSHKARSVEQKLRVDGLTRTFRIYIPADLPTGEAVPLVLVFHGGGGTAWGTERLTGFSVMADRGSFIVAYPEGVERSWNDGRATTVSRAHRDNIDDVHFITTMIDAISKEHRIDSKRIYATGISNGAIFSHYLAANLAARIAAIAPVVGGIAEPFDRRFDPAQPVSVLMFQGTDDPLVPFDGGEVAWGKRGRIISTAATVKKWVERNGCAPTARTGTVPDNDPADGCRAEWSTWSSCRDGTEVTLYTLHGAGHTWPGGAQYLPQAFIGRVCRDIDATEIIWNFFRRHAKS